MAFVNASPYTPAEVIEAAKLSQLYAANAIGNGSLFSPELSPKLARILYVERKSLEWAYDLDPTLSTLQKSANYVWRLCGRFGLKALGILGGGASGGTVVTPVIPGSLGINFLYLIPILASDFTTATEYDDSRIAGKELQVFWKNVQNYQTAYGWRLIYTPNGFIVFVDDGAGGNAFDAFGANTDAEFDIYIVHPDGTSSSPPSPVPSTVFEYDLTANDTPPILAVDLTDIEVGGFVTVSVTPNGFTYTWPSMFLFSDTIPEQPGATMVGTVSIYTFMKVSATKLYVVSVSTNIPL